MTEYQVVDKIIDTVYDEGVPIEKDPAKLYEELLTIVRSWTRAVERTYEEALYLQTK